MIENRILWRKARGEKALGVSMNEPSEEVVELAGRMGLDFVNLDGQHAPVSPQEVGTICRIAEGFGMSTTMRIPDGAESTILSYLDRGVQLIVVPNLQTRAKAEALVKYTFFAPLGLRSSTSYPMVLRQDGPERISLFGGRQPQHAAGPAARERHLGGEPGRDPAGGRHRLLRRRA